MSTHNICFHGTIRQISIIFLIGKKSVIWNKDHIKSYEFSYANIQGNIGAHSGISRINRHCRIGTIPDQNEPICITVWSFCLKWAKGQTKLTFPERILATINKTIKYVEYYEYRPCTCNLQYSGFPEKCILGEFYIPSYTYITLFQVRHFFFNQSY